MNHGLRITSVAAALTLVATAAVADSCPNLLGRWNVTAQSVAYEARTSGPAYTAYVSSAGVLTVWDQHSCLFLAVYQRQRTEPSEPPQPLTGAIGPAGALTLTGYSSLARGKLIGRNRMEVVVSDFAPGGGTINTSIGVAIRE